MLTEIAVINPRKEKRVKMSKTKGGVLYMTRKKRKSSRRKNENPMHRTYARRLKHYRRHNPGVKGMLGPVMNNIPVILTAGAGFLGQTAIVNLIPQVKTGTTAIKWIARILTLIGGTALLKMTTKDSKLAVGFASGSVAETLVFALQGTEIGSRIGLTSSPTQLSDITQSMDNKVPSLSFGDITMIRKPSLSGVEDRRFPSRF